MAAVPGESPWSAFVRDWMIFSPLVITLAAAAQFIYGSDLLTEQLGQGALVTYGLACFVAHTPELRTPGATTPDPRWQAFWQGVWQNFEYVFLIAALALIVVSLGLVVQGADAPKSGAFYSQQTHNIVTAGGYAISAIAFVVAMAAVSKKANRRRAARHG